MIQNGSENLRDLEVQMYKVAAFPGPVTSGNVKALNKSKQAFKQLFVPGKFPESGTFS